MHKLLRTGWLQLSLLTCLAVIMIAPVVSAQDHWVGINQAVPVKEYAGKQFRYSVSAKTDGSPSVLAMIGAQVTKDNGDWGFFENGMNQPVCKPEWSRPAVTGKLDSAAATLNIGIVCMGNGSCSFDDLQLEVETESGQWKPIALKNSGFESSLFEDKLPEGFRYSKPSAHFAISRSPESASDKGFGLNITGVGIEDAESVFYIKSISQVREKYNKFEYSIPMRDGKKLFTAVYVPKDAAVGKSYPILLTRTPYSIAPYGENRFGPQIAPSPVMMNEGYIFVHQDVRGRYRSEGEWMNVRPYVNNKKANESDESTDAWDTIDWLLKNIKNNNGRVGMWGISYPGFFSSAGSIDAHPALKAVSPQAPVADFYFDDFHHNGAFTQAYLPFFYMVGLPRNEPTSDHWFPFFQPSTSDSYNFFKRRGSLKQVTDSLLKGNVMWRDMVGHPDYDSFWKKRRITDHLKNLKPAYLVVGGWFDAEDLYGTLTTYKEIEKNNKGIQNTIVMGPFGHGDWSFERGHYRHHQVYFGDSLATFYQKNIEATFFRHYLKDGAEGSSGLPEAYMFNTGSKKWETFNSWPVATARKQRLFLAAGSKIKFQPPAKNSFSEFISDPAKPVPFTMDVPNAFAMTPRNYMSEDQRFASSRPDVLVFETEVLEQDLTLGGEITARLNVSTTGTDADWVVKLVDVYPDDEPNSPHTPKGVTLSGYQQLVRGDVMRSRWRISFEKPEPMQSGKPTTITFKLQDVLHTFRKGHRLMVQVQSSWFPLIDLNPQKFVPNIYKAEQKDFIKATHRIFSGGANASYLEVDVLPVP